MVRRMNDKARQRRLDKIMRSARTLGLTRDLPDDEPAAVVEDDASTVAAPDESEVELDFEVGSLQRATTSRTLGNRYGLRP